MPRLPTAAAWSAARTRPDGAPAAPIVYRPHAPLAADAERRGRELPTVATVLTADERMRVDAAGAGRWVAAHCDSIDQLATALRRLPAGALLLSAGVVAEGGRAAVLRVAELVREFPAVPAMALASGEVPLATMLALGRAGVHAVADVRRADGWPLVRAALAAAARPDVAELAAAALAPVLADATSDVRRFVAALFAVPPRVGTVRQLARVLGVLPTTLMSRFFRARLPAPRLYLATARLTRAAYLLGNPAWTVAMVADHLEYSSAQSFSRHLHLVLGVRPAEFRRAYGPERMLARFADELVAPYRATLRAFRPLRPS